MRSPLTVHQAKQLSPGAVQGIGVYVDAIDVFSESHEAEAPGIRRNKMAPGPIAWRIQDVAGRIADLHTQIGAQRGNAGIIADIEGRKLLSESVAVDTGKHPLRKIVGKAFGKEMVDAEGLKGVVENGSVATVLRVQREIRKG